MLANIYLHEVVDVWLERMVMPRLKGKAVLVRYADDLVMVFDHEEDARRVLAALPKRFGKYGLTLHPEKTRLVPFRSPHGGRPPKSGTPSGKPGTFDLLGFTHYWVLSQRGYWVVKQKTAKNRLSRAIHRIVEWCRSNRHLPIVEQQRALAKKLRGHWRIAAFAAVAPATLS